MDFIFLTCPQPLTKTYSLDAAGEIVKTPYPLTWEFTSHAEQATTIEELHALLLKYSARNACVLKGLIKAPLVNESRAGSTTTSDATQWVVLDLDGVPESYTFTDSAGNPHTVQVTIPELLRLMGLQDVSYVVQWSASYGIENKRLRAHVFMLLDKPMAAPLLKQWLIALNHKTGVLHDAMSLTKTGNAISWPLDISACQNDKLIYIAPPTLKGIKNPMPRGRITLVKCAKPHLSLDGSIPRTEVNKALTSQRTNELRELAGLPKRDYVFKMNGSVEVLAKPGEAIVTEIKRERGFVYFNLNGGDSWAYYHPENNPDYIFNFKGEPTYLTKELLPEYWTELTDTGARMNSQGTIYLAFCDRNTSSYWRGTYDETSDVLDIAMAKNESQVRHYALQVGLPLGKFIPEWDLSFDPHDNVRVDMKNRTVNRFMLTEYMKATPKPQSKCPPGIFKLVHHVLGNDLEITEHFLNWLAFIVQRRDRTKTAWVLHGCPGTGKGMLFSKVLRPMFGRSQTASQNMTALGENYNHWMQDSLLTFIDEVQTKALINEAGVVAKVKNYITEEYIGIRAMYRGVQECRNYNNFILASNMSSVVHIETGDRRFNVAGYQPAKYEPTDAEIKQIESEVQAFYDYLHGFKLDEEKARTVLDTSDRRTMISLSESSIDTVCGAVLDGNFEFLLEQLPNSTATTFSDRSNFNKVEDYKAVLKSLLDRTDRKTGACSIARDELRVILEYTIGGMDPSPNKFTSRLKHHRIHMTDVWVNNGTTARKERGIKTTWKDLPSWPTYRNTLNPSVPSTKKAKTP